jgi:hypothetical protein
MAGRPVNCSRPKPSAWASSPRALKPCPRLVADFHGQQRVAAGPHPWWSLLRERGGRSSAQHRHSPASPTRSL